MLVLAVVLGAAIGLSLGALGGGGSILTVPVLVFLLGQNAHGATAGSLVIVGVAALVGMAAHARAGRVRVASGLVFGAVGVAGSLVGSRLSAGIDPSVLLSAFAGLMLVAAAALGFRTFRTRSAAARISATRPAAAHTFATRQAVVPPSTVGGEPAKSWSQAGSTVLAREEPDVPLGDPSPWQLLLTRRQTAVRVLLAATVVGLLTGFFGVGGGFVVVPALVLALGFDMPEAVGTSLLVIAINSGVALLARVGTHVHLDWPLLAVFVLGAIAGTIAGNRVASVARPERLALALTILLVAVALYTGGRSLPHLM